MSEEMSIEALRALRDAKKLKKQENHEKRKLEIGKLHLVEGLTLDAIGKRYGLTRQRVHQIIESL